ncbi:MAG: RNA polymerase sigma factor [Gemmataceae bacterium]|nr:RNA polymerase sigma factor [Gemmataceae bacterium]
MQIGTPLEGRVMTDAELVRQTLAGAPAAYEELVRRWAGRVTALCHAKIGCAAHADDLAQDALLRAYRSLQSLVEPEKFGAWLCRIALHTCLSWLKNKQRTQVPFSVLGADQNPEDYLSSGDSVDEEHEDALDRLKKEVAALPESYREVLLLYYHQDVTYRDLAEMLGVSPATVNSRLTKARNLLRERMNQCRK